MSLDEIASACSQLLMEKGCCRVLCSDPDESPGHFPGEPLAVDGGKLMRHRPWKTWVELAESLGAKLGTPRLVNDGVFSFSLKALKEQSSWHLKSDGGKYGGDSAYLRIDKREDAFWLRDYRQALESCGLKRGQKVLSLGCGKADELSVFGSWFPELEPHLEFLGLDSEASALDMARQRMPQERYCFEQRDIALEPWQGEREVDLLLSIATLQSSSFEGKAVFRQWYQSALKKEGCVILGFPCCRYVDGEVISGPKVRNYRHPEWSLLVKDLAYYSRYLSSHKKKVILSGRNTLFLTALPV